MRVRDAQILSYLRLLYADREYESVSELATSISHHHELNHNSIHIIIKELQEWWGFPFLDDSYGLVVLNEHGLIVTDTCLQMVGGWDITQPRHTGHLQRIQLTAKVYVRDGEWLGVREPWTEQYVETIDLDDIAWILTAFRGEQFSVIEDLYKISYRNRRRKMRGFEWLIGGTVQNMSTAVGDSTTDYFMPNALGEAIMPLLARWAEDWQYLLKVRQDLNGVPNEHKGKLDTV